LWLVKGVWLKRSIYIDLEDAQITEIEERSLFIRSVLEQMGVPLDDIWTDILLSVEQMVMLRRLLLSIQIEIIDDGDRGTKIFNNDILLAEWKKPRFILRIDNSSKKQAKKLYYEMIVETYFNEENKNE
jgi:hypothetical protein